MTAVLLDVGDILDGRYQLVRDLGRGAAGVVFEARHLFTGRIVAVKMVMPYSRGANMPELRARLQREGRAMAAIHHPGVVEILDGGVTLDGSPYIVMDMLEGRTLEGLVASRRRLPVAASVAVALQLCDALDAVHGAGVVHRDVKPANIVVVKGIGQREVVRLVDFGIAVFERASEEKLTSQGAVLGTPAYMPPEHLLQQGGPADATVDVYAVGVTLYECLTGVMPHPGNLAQVLLSVSREGPPSSVRTILPEVPSALAAVVDRSIAKARADRYRTARDLAAAIEEAVPAASRHTTLLGPPAVPTDGVSGEQRRRAARVPYNTPCRLTIRDGHIDGRTEDIAESGVLVLSFADCEPSQRVALRFALPMDGKIVAIEADVRWVRASDQPTRQGMRAIGLEFVQPPAEMKASIAQYVKLMSEREPAA